MSDSVLKVTRERMREEDLPEGFEILRIIFEKQGPMIVLSDAAEQMLRGKDSEKMRAIIEDSLKAVLDKIMIH